MKWIKLGDYIDSFSKKCGDSNAIVSGVDITKQFIPTRANLDDVDVSKYYVVPPMYLACNLMHIGRDERIPIALNTSGQDLIVTAAYYVFKIKDDMKNKLLEEYLYMFFKTSELDRLTWFYTDSSIRGNLRDTRFLEIEMPLPAIDEQKRIVAAWKGLKNLKEENENLADPLLSLCQSYLEKLKKDYEPVEIKSYIEQCDERNSGNNYTIDDVKGVSINKVLIETKANMANVSLVPYKLVKPQGFVFVTITSRNGGKISLAMNNADRACIVSSSYEVFYVKNHEGLLPDYLYLWFCRDEFDRYARFNSWGSAREAFSYTEMCRVKIPLPPIEIQKAIVEIYRCSKESKQIAESAGRLSNNACPALMQQVIGA